MTFTGLACLYCPSVALMAVLTPWRAWLLLVAGVVLPVLVRALNFRSGRIRVGARTLG